MSGESLGAALRRHRTAADLTLEALAERSGVSDRTIGDVERGVSVGPQRRTVDLLADALGLVGDDRDALLAAARAGRSRATTGAFDAPQAAAPLPRGVSDFAGRRLELEVLAAHLASGAAGSAGPVAVVSGPPGFGKTSLAVRAATDAAAAFEATCFVNLRGYDARPVDALTLLNRLIHAVDPTAGAVPGDLDAAAALWHDVLVDRKVLVVLDNAATEEQVRAAIPAAGPTAVVITTRGTLAGLEDVRRVSIGQLSAAESMGLLRTIVAEPQAAGQDLERLAALCHHVPLALRIAGNRLASRQTWTVDDLAARLAADDRRLDGLRAGDLGIRAAVASSYERLSVQGRRTFRRLAFLRGSAFGDAVAARLVPTDLRTAEDLLDELAELGLVQSAAAGRYHLHDLLRLFARARLHEEEPLGDRIAVEADLRHWLLHVTVLAGRWFEPDYESAPAAPDPLVPLETPAQAQTWLRDEVEHWLTALRGAAGAGEHRLVVDVAESLHWFSDLWVHWGHWHEVFALAVAAARALGDDDALATQLGYLSWAELYTRLEPEVGLARALEAGRVAHRAGNARQAGWAAVYATNANKFLERYDEALACAERAQALLGEAGDVEGHLQARRGTAIVLRWLERHEEAIALERVVLADLDDPTLSVSPHVASFTRIAAMSAIVHNLTRLERWAEAVEVATGAVALLDGTPVASIQLRVLQDRARALTALGRHEEAAADEARRVAIYEAIGDASGAEAARTALEASTPASQRPPRHT